MIFDCGLVANKFLSLNSITDRGCNNNALPGGALSTQTPPVAAKQEAAEFPSSLEFYCLVSLFLGNYEQRELLSIKIFP